MARIFCKTLTEIMSAPDFIERRSKIALPTTASLSDSLFWDYGEGNWLFKNGKKYLDWGTQGGIKFLGHTSEYHLKFATLAFEFLTKGRISGVDPDTGHQLEVELKEKILQTLPEEYKDAYVHLDLSGALANNFAVLLSRRARPGRNYFGAFERAFHGRHGASLDLTGSNTIQKPIPYQPAVNVVRMPYPDSSRTSEYIARNYKGTFDFLEMCAFFVELIQGEGGVHPATPALIQEFAEQLRAREVLLVADECQTAMARTGDMFAFEYANIHPDIITISKMFGWIGLPLSAVIVKQSVVARASLPFGWYSGTMMGQPLACLSALVILEAILNQGLHKSAHTLGNLLYTRFKDSLRGIEEVREIRGRGLMMGIEFIDKSGGPNVSLRSKVIEKCFEKGLIVITAGNPFREAVIRLLPSLLTTSHEIEFGADVITESVKEALGK